MILFIYFVCGEPELVFVKNELHVYVNNRNQYLSELWHELWNIC